MEDEKFVSAIEAANLLNVSRTSINLYFRKGVFKTAKKERDTRWFVSLAEIEGILDGSIEANFKGLAD